MAQEPKKNAASAIMVFRPTMEEFKDFSKYISYMESQGAMRGGIAKIIPPPEWKPRAKGYDDIDSLVIPAPIEQVVDGRSGAYTQINITKKARTLKQFRELAESTVYRTPYHEDYDDLDRKYWKNLTYNHALYGADVSGSLYDSDVKEFNINCLNTCLDAIGEDYGIKIEGVNTAYLYFGMWKTTFPWHTEDMDLYSINFLHFGAPKSWFAIPPEHGRRFERVAENYFFIQKQECSAFLRHKMTILSPQILRNNSIPFNKVTQEPGEFIITFPYGYHSGYNHGYNCAESTNFALERWIEYGKRCTQCTCRNDGVKINMDVFVRRFQPDKYQLWLKGEDVATHPEDPLRMVTAGPQGKTKIRGEKKMAKAHLKRHPPHSPNQIATGSKSTANVMNSEDDKSDTSKGKTKTPKSATLSVKRKNATLATLNKKQKKSVQSTKSKKKLKADQQIETKSEVGQHVEAKPKASEQVETNSEVSKQTQIKSSTSATDIVLTQSIDSRTIAKPFLPKNEHVPVSISSEIPTSSLQQCLPQLNISSPYTGQVIPSVVSTENDIKYETLIFNNQPVTVKVVKPPKHDNFILPHLSPKLLNHQLDCVLPTSAAIPNISVKSWKDSSSSLSSPPVPIAIKNATSNAATTLLELSQQQVTPPTNNHDQDSSISEACGKQDDALKNGQLQNASTSKPNCDNHSSQENYVTSEVYNSNGSPDKANGQEIISDDITSNMKEAWHQVCRHIWQYLPPNLEAEKKYNQWISLVKPHCSVCMIFKPFVDVISRKDVLPNVPEASSLEIPLTFYELLCGSYGLLDYDGPRTLLTCTECGVCVHDCCYGVVKAPQSWKCDTCSSGSSTHECFACNLRGGALKPTTNGKWIHVVCALILPGIKFKDSMKLVQYDFVNRRKNLKCMFCGNKSVNRNSDSACTQCSKGKCTQSFHVTCGYAAGVTFKMNEWPALINALCLRHSEIKPKSTQRKMLPISEGTEVFAKHKNSRYYRSEIVTITTETFYSVVFDDGTQSEDLYPEDIVSHDCLKYGPPQDNERVSVKWTDGCNYTGIFIDSSSCVMCQVQFQDGSVAKVKRENVYVEGEEMPKKVSSRLSTATEGKHTDIFNEKSEGKRIRHANTKYISKESNPHL